MFLHQKVFIICIAFLIGVGLAHLVPFVWVMVMICLVLGLIFLFIFIVCNRPSLLWAFLFCVCSALGYGYVLLYSYLCIVPFQGTYAVSTTVIGTIDSSPQFSEKSQRFLFRTVDGEIFSVIADRFSNYTYNERVSLSGVVENPFMSSYAGLYKKDHVVGVMTFPRIVHIADSSPSVRGYLYIARSALVSVLYKSLTFDEASLASGMLLGQESAVFSNTLKDFMKASGTTHIVALSGYNISILVVVLFLFLNALFSRRMTFIFSIVCIFIFVLMTGAESSVVRAAFMGSFILLATHCSRVYSFRQAMSITAFCMVLYNPFILFFDYGFILSFLSLWGISYIAPAILALWKPASSILSFLYTTALQTISAQIMVLPILCMVFGGASIVSIFANMLILPLVSLVMALSFFVGLFGLFLSPLAHIVAILLAILCDFQVWVICFFGRYSLMQVSVPVIGFILYYCVVCGGVLWLRKRHNILSLNPMSLYTM